jgi:hypothetical protein
VLKLKTILKKHFCNDDSQANGTNSRPSVGSESPSSQKSEKLYIIERSTIQNLKKNLKEGANRFAIPSDLKMDHEKVDALFTEILSVLHIQFGVVIQGIYNQDSDLINRGTVLLPQD